MIRSEIPSVAEMSAVVCRNGGIRMETEMQRVTIPGLDGTLWVTCFSLVLTLSCVVHGERQPCGYHVQGGSPNETGRQQSRLQYNLLP